MERTKVLFVDDDIVLGQVVTMALRSYGYVAEYCTSLVGIRGVVKEMNPDILLLDVEIGEGNGIEACAGLKAIAPDIPILFVSSHIAAQEVAKGLDAGGIAYLKKPFEIEELMAYIRRHAPGFHAAGILFGKFSLHTEDEMLLKDGEVVKRLTPFEFKILKLLVQNMNRTVTREQLERELWENGQAASEYSLNNYMAKLRKYLADDETISLEVVPKVGYMLSVS